MDKVKTLLDEQKFTAAFEILDAELARAPANVEALLLRSTAHTRRSELDAALADAERAVVHSRGSADAQLRRAICLFRLKRLNEAAGLLQYFPATPQAETWKQLIAHGATDPSAVPEIPDLPNGSGNASTNQGPNTSNTGTASNSNTGTGTSTGTNTASKTNTNKATTTANTNTSNSVNTAKMDWYQTPSTVTVTLYRKGLAPDATKVSIDPAVVAVHSGDFAWSLPLGNPIDPAESRYELTAFKIEFVLKKQEHTTWKSLESSETAVPAPQPAKTTEPKLTYSKWEKLDDGDDAEAESGDPMAFFKNLYKDASPETQRAMMKSYIESNGTALSTNWEEVSKGKVETHPPRDLEVRK